MPSSQRRHHLSSKQKKVSTRRNPLPVTYSNCKKIKVSTTKAVPPDLSSEISLSETLQPLDQAYSLVSNSSTHRYSKRSRLDTENHFGSYSSFQGLYPFTNCGSELKEILDFGQPNCSSDHCFHDCDQDTSIHSRLGTIQSSEISTIEKTGSCNSKRLRGKGHIVSSSAENTFIIDQNHQKEFGLYPSTTHPKAIGKPVDVEELNQKTSVFKVFTYGLPSHEELEAPVGGGEDSAWFRSLACFANGSREQAALDFSGGANLVNRVNNHATLSAPSDSPGTCHPHGLVFSNPASSTALHDFPSSSVGSGGILRFVSSFASTSSSSSSKLRSHRGAPSGRHDSNKRNVPGPSSSRSAGLGVHASNASGFNIQHYSQTSIQHHQQGSGINNGILQLKLSPRGVASQLVLLQEINQALLMGSEESLAGLAVHDLVSAIVDLLDTEKSVDPLPDDEMIELKNLSCNILAHLMDVMPKAADAVVMAVPLLLSTISCSFVGDILERIINVLEQVSRRNGRQILLCGGVTTVMGYYDFVTVTQHRTILSMVANCFADVRSDDFSTHVASCLPSLCERLACQGPGVSTEPRCIERVCLCFARLIEAFKTEPEKLREIASFGLSQHLKHLMAASPPVVSNMKDIAYMLATLCTYCPDLAVDILKMGYAETIYTLLTDHRPFELSFHIPNTKCGTNASRSTSARNKIAQCLENRGVENVYAIIHLISAMLPPIPDMGTIMLPPSTSPSSSAFAPAGTMKMVDTRAVLFLQQCKIFEDRALRNRRRGTSGDREEPLSSADTNTNSDKSVSLMLVRTAKLFLPMLLDLYIELNGTAPRLKCVEAIQKIVSNTSPFVLSWMVSPRSVSATIADMLGSPEFALIAVGLQLANLFFTRIPQVFAVYFRKEGVLFHLQLLSSMALDRTKNASASCAEEFPSSSALKASRQAVCMPSKSTLEAANCNSLGLLPLPQNPISSSQWISSVSPATTSAAVGGIGSSHVRSRTSRRITMEDVSALKPPHFSNICDMNAFKDLSQATTASSLKLDRDLNGELNKVSSNPICPTLTVPSNVAIDCNDNKLREWIASQCRDLYDRIQTLVIDSPKLETLPSKAVSTSRHRKSTCRHPPSINLMALQEMVPRDLVPELEAISHQLLAVDDPGSWLAGLIRLAGLLTQTNLPEDEAPSPFEIRRSGLLNALYMFITQPTERKLRLFLLLRVFVGTRYTENINLKKLAEKRKMLAQTASALQSMKHQINECSMNELAFPMLINCLLDCLHQQEHFQVLTGPRSLTDVDAFSEDVFPSMRQSSGGNDDAQSETRHRRSVSMQQGASQFPRDQSSDHPPPRRCTNSVPGFLKLQLVRQIDKVTANTSTTAATSSRRTPLEEGVSIKGTFWENAPTTLSLHVSALTTTSSLQRLLMQRSFVASIMRGSDNQCNIQHTNEDSFTSPFAHPSSHPRRFYRRHDIPTEDSISSKTRSAHHASTFSNVHHESLNLTKKYDVVDKASASKHRETARPKNMSLLSAFGMRQFAGSTTPPHPSMATTTVPSFFSLNPIPSETVSNVVNSHSRSSIRKDYSSHSHSHQHHSNSTRQQHQHPLHHHAPLPASYAVGNLFERTVLNNKVMHAFVPVIFVSGTRISSQMPLYQAIREFSTDVSERGRQLLTDHRFSLTEQNREDKINAFMWHYVHTVHYRLEKSDASTASLPSPSSFIDSPTGLLSSASLLRGVTSGTSVSSSALSTPTANAKYATNCATAKSSSTSTLSAAISCLKRLRRPDEIPHPFTQSEAKTPSPRLLTFLEPLTDCQALSNGCMAPNLILLRALYGLSEVGNTLDDFIEPFPIVPASHFQSQKLSAKASRQLQDAFCVLAGNLPSWLLQTISACPFLFPFSVRKNFFYVYNFDRDRTILHLQDSIANGSIDSETPSGSNGGDGNADTVGVDHISSSLSRFPQNHHFDSVRLNGHNGSANSTAVILESLLMDSASQVQRHKITVHRDPKRLLRAAESALNELRDSHSILEIAFDGEVGFGLGPTSEFYTLVSHQLMTANLNLWHGHNYTAEGYIIAPAPGLYPRPLAKSVRSSQSREVFAKFFFLGQLMARSLLDLRQLDLSLSPTLFKWFLYVRSFEEDLVLSSPRVGVTANDLALVDPSFAKHYRSLLKLSRRRQELLEDCKTVVMAVEEEIRAIDTEVDDLCLSFVLPGYQIELCRNGSQTAVTGSNLSDYLRLCSNWFLVEGIRRQIIALIEGFDCVLPGIRTDKLATLFRPDECEGLFCGSVNLGGLYRDQLALLRTSITTPLIPPMSPFVGSSKTAPSSSSAAAAGWDVDTLVKSCLCDHGYTMQSKAIQYLFEIMSGFDEPRRRLFIQFTTGSPRLPIGGFRALKPPLKIVLKREAEESADQHLPSVMTCQNYLKLPNYSTKEIMQEKLLYAIYEGQHAFHLS